MADPTEELTKAEKAHALLDAATWDSTTEEGRVLDDLWELLRNEDPANINSESSWNRRMRHYMEIEIEARRQKEKS